MNVDNFLLLWKSLLDELEKIDDKYNFVYILIKQNDKWDVAQVYKKDIFLQELTKIYAGKNIACDNNLKKTIAYMQGMSLNKDDRDGIDGVRVFLGKQNDNFAFTDTEGKQINILIKNRVQVEDIPAYIATKRFEYLNNISTNLFLFIKNKVQDTQIQNFFNEAEYTKLVDLMMIRFDKLTKQFLETNESLKLDILINNNQVEKKVLSEKTEKDVDAKTKNDVNNQANYGQQEQQISESIDMLIANIDIFQSIQQKVFLTYIQKDQSMLTILQNIINIAGITLKIKHDYQDSSYGDKYKFYYTSFNIIQKQLNELNNVSLIDDNLKKILILYYCYEIQTNDNISISNFLCMYLDKNKISDAFNIMIICHILYENFRIHSINYHPKIGNEDKYNKLSLYSLI